jgi:acyl-coenzyme A synthetase/AMP-(fatty) acid ligase
VVLNFREFLLNIDPLAAGWGLTAADRLYDFRPFSWNSAQTLGGLAVLNSGATLVLAEKFSASRFFQHLREYGVTISTGNPTTINILLNSEQTAHRDSVPKLRFITSSSAPLLLEECDDGDIKIHSRARYRTGDLGCLDTDGFLMLTGREKEQIIRGGAKISPVEIDSYLMQRPDVIEAATVGVPDAIYGEEVISYVVMRPGAAVDADELLRYCAKVLPAFKAPKQIVISASSLPKTERGKLDRRALAAAWSRDGNDLKSGRS